MQIHQRAKTVIASLIAIVVVIMGLEAMFHSAFSDAWSLPLINGSLKVPIPNSVLDLAFDGRRGRGGYLELRFRTLNEKAKVFTDQFCEGQLHQGYDPFHATDSLEYEPKSVLIKLGQNPQYTYYSRSPGTLTSLYGNRCLSPSGQYQVTVDLSEPLLSSVHLEWKYTCTLCWISTPVPNQNP
ncbi:hypothetical protein ARNL5_03196 [Anaerolineae bacterium]|nr:hypothetical protein ARNL5_03196 [Anaerolineae bacterium]